MIETEDSPGALPDTIPHDAPLTTIERGDNITEEELEELRREFEKLEQEKENKNDRYIVKLRA
jgi:hypothetical protein